MGKTNLEQCPKMLIMLISRTCAWSMQIFLPPKEAQGKVRQSQGRLRPITLRFRAKARKLILESIGTPLDHLSVKFGFSSPKFTDEPFVIRLLGFAMFTFNVVTRVRLL